MSYVPASFPQVRAAVSRGRVELLLWRPPELVDATISEETKRELMKTIALGRAGEMDDMAGLVLFLASKVGYAPWPGYDFL